MLAMLSLLDLLIVAILLAVVIGAGILVYLALKRSARIDPPDAPRHE